MNIKKEQLLNITTNLEANVIDTKIKDKLTYAIRRFLSLNEKAITSLKTDIEDIRIEHADTDANGRILYDDKGRNLFTREQERALRLKIKNFLQEKIEVTPFYCTDLTRVKELHYSVIDMFNGVIFNITEEELWQEQSEK